MTSGAGSEEGASDGLAGGCICRAVRYRIATAPIVSLICHCATCRRAVGAQAVGWLSVAASGFAWTAGAPAVYASSPGVERTHCPVCGASLTYRSEAATIDVTLASLDDPEAAPPTRETWLTHRLRWTPVSHDLPGFPEDGEG